MTNNTLNKPKATLAESLVEEIAANGPGTAEQLGEAVGLSFDLVIGKLIGMERDGLLQPFHAFPRYTIWGLKT